MIYNELVLNYFFYPTHVGKINQDDCRTAKINNMYLFVQCDNQGIVIRANFKAKTNPYKIAGLEWLCRELEGEPLSNHPRIDYQQIMTVLDIPALRYPEAIELETLYKKVTRG